MNGRWCLINIHKLAHYFHQAENKRFHSCTCTANLSPAGPILIKNLWIHKSLLLSSPLRIIYIAMSQVYRWLNDIFSLLCSWTHPISPVDSCEHIPLQQSGNRSGGIILDRHDHVSSSEYISQSDTHHNSNHSSIHPCYYHYNIFFVTAGAELFLTCQRSNYLSKYTSLPPPFHTRLPPVDHRYIQIDEELWAAASYHRRRSVSGVLFQQTALQSRPSHGGRSDHLHKQLILRGQKPPHGGRTPAVRNEGEGVSWDW